MSVAPAHDVTGQLVAYVATYKDLSAAQHQARLERAPASVARVVASGATAKAVFERVSAEAAGLLGVSMAEVVRFDDLDHATH